MENWLVFAEWVAAAAGAALLYWFSGKMEWVAIIKHPLNIAGGVAAILSGAFWASNASIALLSETDSTLTHSANMFNSLAARVALIAAVLLVIPYVLDSLSRPPKQNDDTLTSSIEIAGRLVELPSDVWERELVRQTIHAGQLIQVLKLMVSILTSRAKKSQ